MMRFKIALILKNGVKICSGAQERVVVKYFLDDVVW